MKSKVLNFGIIFTSLLGYTEWGEDQSMFLFQGELEVLSKVFSSPESIIHPFIGLPLLGQLILVYTLFQKRPSKILSYLGIGLLGILLLMLLFIGVISKNIMIIGCTLPFILLSIYTLLYYRKLEV